MLFRRAVLPLAFAGVLGGFFWSGSAVAQERATTTVVRDTVDHTPFTRVLRTFVDEKGDVDYAGLRARADSLLDPYLQQLATTDPAALGRDARLAFWINAYNAYTLKLIADHYPVENIWAVTPGPAAPKDENSPFDLAVGRVADTTRTLNEIEHQIIRPRFDEPRIHFALVCAAKSCPLLRREAYTGPRLEAQLEEQTRTFFHEDKNRIPAGADRIALSRILKWYGEDFGDSTDDLQRFIAPYFDGTVADRLEAAAYEVTFLDYDWTLNDQGRASASTGAPGDDR
jgi:hypothetical protein